jgi:hypothetical protein
MALSGQKRMKCDFVFFEIDCVYNLTGLSLGIENSHITANETPITSESGGICPDESKIDALLGPLDDPIYVLS